MNPLQVDAIPPPKISTELVTCKVCSLGRKGPIPCVCVIPAELEKPLFTCLAMTLTCSIKSSNKKLCDKNAKACLS